MGGVGGGGVDIVTRIEIKGNMAWFLQIQLSYLKRERRDRLVRGMCKHGFVPSSFLGNIVMRVGEKKRKKKTLAVVRL